MVLPAGAGVILFGIDGRVLCLGAPRRRGGDPVL